MENSIEFWKGSNFDFYSKNKSEIDKILKIFSEYGLYPYSPTAPDFYILPKAGRLTTEITHWGYRKLAKLEGIIINVSHISKEAVKAGYFAGYNPQEKKINYDSAKWKPEFSIHCNYLSEIAFFVVEVEKEGKVQEFVFEPDWIEKVFKPKFKPKDNGKFLSLWLSKDYNGICMREKSIVRHVLKRRICLPDKIQQFDPSYEEYHYGDIVERVEGCESIEDLRELYKSSKDLFKNPVLADLAKKKAEVLKNNSGVTHV